MGVFGKMVMYPMMLLQYLTTREPDLRPLAVAICALNVALGKDSEARE
jgi:uncharacterized protein YqhQ